MSEIWRDIAGYEGFYQVSSHGRVKSLPRSIVARNGVWSHRRGRVLSQSVRRRQYLRVCLSKDDVQRHVNVHRLVAQAFLSDSYFDGAVICHNDGDGTNNRVENLRWDTQSSNIFDAVRARTHNCASKTRCVRGHEYSPENTRIRAYRHKGRPATSRVCKQCAEIWRENKRVADRRTRAAQRAAGYKRPALTAAQKARHAELLRLYRANKRGAA